MPSEDQLHPGGPRQTEAGLLVDALPVRGGAEVDAIGADRPRPIDDVTNEEGSVSSAAVLGHGDHVRQPHRSSSTALRVGDPELQRADRRRHDDAIDLDHRQASRGRVLDHSAEPPSCVLLPRHPWVGVLLVEQQPPQEDQLRGIGRCGDA